MYSTLNAWANNISRSPPEVLHTCKTGATCTKEHTSQVSFTCTSSKSQLFFLFSDGLAPAAWLLLCPALPFVLFSGLRSHLHSHSHIIKRCVPADVEACSHQIRRDIMLKPAKEMAD
jgi:hypothetical protein